MDFALISMGMTRGKHPVLEHCCYSLCQEKTFPNEMALAYFTLKKYGKKCIFLDGNLISEGEILKTLKKTKPKRILYYLYTPYLREKASFLKNLSELSKVYLVASPFFWREKILKEFPFIEDVFYDAEKGLRLNTSSSPIDYSEFDLEVYLKQGRFSVIVSKYCPYSCTYCNAQRTGLLQRDLEIVKKEILYLKERGIKKFVLSGNNLTIDKKNFIELCRFMKRENLSWEGDARINHMDEEIYSALEDCNCTLLFGVESADQMILDKIQKNLKISEVIKNSDKLTKKKIPFIYTFMFGFPWDSRKTAEDLIRLRRKIKPINYQCNFVSAYPGTPLFKEMSELMLLDEDSLDYEDFSWNKLPLARTLYLSKSELNANLKKILLSGAARFSVIKNIIKTRKIRDYPTVALHGLKLILDGKRSWKQ